jgi:hypothetical protein
MPFLTCFALADNQAIVNIHMIHQNPRQALGNPAIVAGIWHNINVTLESNNFQQLNIEFYKGNSKPDSKDRDSTNYYEWEYNANTRQWADALRYGGYNYLNSDLSQKNGNTYSFCIGVNFNAVTGDYSYIKNKNTIYYENFTLNIYEDDNEINSGNVVVEIPITGIARPHGDLIRFNVDPFTKMTDDADDYFKIENKGNIPLIIDIDYGENSDILEVPGLGSIIPAFESFTYDEIKVHSKSWKPGIINIDGPPVEGAIPEGYKITTAPLSFSPVPGIDSPDFEIRVGRGTYELKEEIFENTDISFQYPTSLSMSEGEEKEIIVYVSGNGPVTLNFGTENIKIKKIIYQNTETSTPININSKNTSEYPVKIRIQALRQNIDAKLIYYLSYDGELYYINKNNELPSTSVTVGPPVQDSSSGFGISILQIIAVVAIIGLVMFYMLNTRRRHRWR